MSDEPDDGGLSADACLRLLSHARRRAVLLSIYEAGDDAPVSVEEAVGDGELSEAAAVALNHNHLPMLAEHGVVRWDRDAGTVAPGPAFDRIEPFLDRLDGARDRLPDDWRSGGGS